MKKLSFNFILVKKIFKIIILIELNSSIQILLKKVL